MKRSMFLILTFFFIVPTYNVTFLKGKKEKINRLNERIVHNNTKTLAFTIS